MSINWNPDWSRPENMRANYLVTFGCRAGVMACHGRIRHTTEDRLAALGRNVVNDWELWLECDFNEDPDTMYWLINEYRIKEPCVVSFDEFIESALLKYLPVGKED